MAETLVRPVAADLDWAALRFPGEAELRQEVARRPDLLAVAQRWAGPGMCPLPLPTGLRHGGLNASAAAVPALARVAELVQAALRLDAPPTLVVFPAAEPLIERLPGPTVRIAVSSGAIGRLSVREALFAVGRRLARPRYGQAGMFADPTAGNPGREQHVLLLRGLWKFEELTCDRVGLLCCQDADAASRAILKLASGLGDDLLAPDFDALLAERGAEEEAMVADDPNGFALLRIAALRQFAATPRYAALFDRPAEPRATALPSAAFAGSESRILAPAPPVPAPPAMPGAEYAGAAFALWGALWTLGEDAANPSAAARLFDLFGSAAAAAADEGRGPEGEALRARRCAELAQPLAGAPRERRIELLADVVDAAAGDGHFDAVRRRRATEVAELLGLGPADVAALAAEHADPEFADYEYRLDQAVEVQFDDEWTAGVVRKIAPTGNLRVFFPATGETLWLSRTADVIRPVAAPTPALA